MIEYRIVNESTGCVVAVCDDKEAAEELCERLNMEPSVSETFALDEAISRDF